MWELYTDGTSTTNGAGAGYVIIPLSGEPLACGMLLSYSATNNETECMALITGLLIARGGRAWKIHVNCDSQPVVNQLNGTYEAREVFIRTFGEKVKSIAENFDLVVFECIPRHNNILADSLSKAVMRQAYCHVHSMDVRDSSLVSIERRSDLRRKWGNMVEPNLPVLGEGPITSDPIEARRIKARVA